MDDNVLMRRVAAGDATAFARLVQAFQPRLTRFATRLLGSVEEAEDAVQEAFVRIWRGHESFRCEGHAAAYFFRIVRNGCLDRIRCRPNVQAELSDMFDRCDESDGADPADAARAAVLSEAVRRAVERLPEPARSVFLLSHYEGLSYAETGAALGLTVGMVASHKRQAVLAMRRRLHDWMEE